MARTCGRMDSDFLRGGELREDAAALAMHRRVTSRHGATRASQSSPACGGPYSPRARRRCDRDRGAGAGLGKVRVQPRQPPAVAAPPGSPRLRRPRLGSRGLEARRPNRSRRHERELIGHVGACHALPFKTLGCASGSVSRSRLSVTTPRWSEIIVSAAASGRSSGAHQIAQGRNPAAQTGSVEGAVRHAAIGHASRSSPHGERPCAQEEVKIGRVEGGTRR